MHTPQHIFRQYSRITPSLRQSMLRQSPHLFWFTGLSGAGKSTIAYGVEQELHRLGHLSFVLDGDNVRHGLCKDLGFTPQERRENIRRIGEICTLFLEAGVICLAAFISPSADDRRLVKNIVGEKQFSEIFVRCPLAVCEARDPKGNYKKARSGIIQQYTGVSSPYEEPEQPALVLDTSIFSLAQCVEKVMQYAHTLIHCHYNTAYKNAITTPSISHVLDIAMQKAL